MSNTRYLEIDSTYRDRTLWPSPGEFDVLISQTGRKSKLDSIDPVSLGTPIKSWTSNRFIADTGGATISTLLTLTGVANTSENTTFVVTGSAGDLQEEEGYYNGSVAQVSFTGNLVERRRIVSYKYLGNLRAEITVFPSLGSSETSVTVTISDPTDITTTDPNIFVPSGSNSQNAYSGCYLYNETLNEYRRISEYDNVTHILSLDLSTGNFAGWLATHNFTIRKDIPSLLSTTTAASTNRSIVISNGINVDDIYKGDFIRIKASTYGTQIISPENEIRRIVSYDSATKTAIVAPSFSTTINPASLLEILSFSHDNLNPFVYTGSYTSQQEMVCYEIELVNLLLPNETLSNQNGGRIAFYPYVYVELNNISGSSSGNVNTIYSNNPNSTKMTFRAAIDDTPTPTVSKFIKIDGDGMVQTIKFKPNDSLHFSVTLPDGSVFNTILDESVSPYPPNGLIQISALFSMKRL
ncbi:MAG: hypothetical protein ACW98X_20815 [Promethearchaeota archaeon]|jgi:hypothetical protein